jgi:hypothetical protein
MRLRVLPAAWVTPFNALALGGILWCLPAWTADDTHAKSPYAREISQVEDVLRRHEEELAGLTHELETLGDFGKSDARLAQEDYGRLFQTGREAIAAYRRGDAEMARLRRQETEQSRLNRLWRRRYEARDRQAQSWPPEQWVFDLETQKGDARTKAHAPRYVAVRRQASLAWARLAEAIAPGAEEGRLIELENKAYAAEAEVRAAAAIWVLYVEVYYRTANPKVQSPELAAKLQTVERWRESIQAIHRDRAEVERRQREWDRTRERLNQEIAEAYEQAWKEADRRAARKQK